MDVLKNRAIYFIVSGVLLLLSIGFLLFGKLNLAIDMTGGINMEYSYDNSVNITELKENIQEIADTILYEGKEAINNVGVYTITGEKAFSVVVGFDSNINEKTVDNLKLEFREKIFESLSLKISGLLETKYTNIGKTFGDYIKNTAYLTLFLSAIAITVYIWYAFSGIISGINPINFAGITLFTLFHDVLISAGLYIGIGFFFQDFQVDTFFVTALLTILGYSINDTIVIFDRIRLNLKNYGGKSGKHGRTLYEIINMSVADTIKRSIFTSLTLVFVLSTIFLFGPTTLSGFILVMLLGTVVGTYSSIFIASPLLYQINKNQKLTVYREKVSRLEDKIVV